jgi:hypothetical protein
MLKVQGFKAFFVLCTFELELPLVTQGPLPCELPGEDCGAALAEGANPSIKTEIIRIEIDFRI